MSDELRALISLALYLFPGIAVLVLVGIMLAMAKDAQPRLPGPFGNEKKSSRMPAGVVLGLLLFILLVLAYQFATAPR